jgi:hypothetical protein
LWDASASWTCSWRDVQRELTAAANRSWTAKRRAAWAETDRAITTALDAFERTVVSDPPLVHALRAVRRSTAAVGRKVASD